MVITGGIPTTGQTIVLNNQEFVLQPATTAAGGTTVIPNVQPPPYSAIINQPPPTNDVQSRPLPAPGVDGYMELQRDQNPTADTSVPPRPSPRPERTLDYTSGEYAYVDDLNVNNATSEEYYDDVGAPTRSASQEVEASRNNDPNINRARIPTPDECNPQGSTSQDPAASNTTYSYASTDDIKNQSSLSSSGDQQYLNSGVQRPRTERNLQHESSIPEYLEVLP